MLEQTSTQARPGWRSYGVVLLIMLFAFGVVAIQDARVAKAAAQSKPK